MLNLKKLQKLNFRNTLISSEDLLKLKEILENGAIKLKFLDLS